MASESAAQRARTEFYVKDNVVFLNKVPIPLNRMLTVKPLVFQLLLSVSADTVREFEQWSRKTRQLVREMEIWRHLFQRDFPLQYERNYDPDMTIDYDDKDDGTAKTFRVAMRRSMMEYLDEHSKNPFRVFTYWKRFYEMLFKAKFKSTSNKKTEMPTTLANFTRYEFLNIFINRFGVNPEKIEFFLSNAEPTLFYVVGRSSEVEFQEIFGENIISIGFAESDTNPRINWVPYDATLLTTPMDYFTISPSGKLVIAKYPSQQVIITLTHFWVATFVWPEVGKKPSSKNTFLVSCSMCEVETSKGFHRFDGHEEHKFCSEKCAYKWWDAK